MSISYVKNRRSRPTLRMDRSNQPLIPTHALSDLVYGWRERWSPPEIDLSIVTFRSATELESLFDSLLRQSYPLDRINLLLMRHAEDAVEQAVIDDFVGQHGASFKLVRVASQRNLGFGGGHNANFRESQSRHFVVCNADVEFFDDTLTKLVQFALFSVKECAAVEARQFPFDHPKFYDPATFETSWQVCCLVLFDREAFKKVDGFDEILFMYGEDVDISLRLRSLGYRLAFNPFSRVMHDVKRQRERNLVLNGGMEASWLVGMSANPLHTLFVFAPRYVGAFFDYLRRVGTRNGARRLIALTRRALARYFKGLLPGRRRLQVPANGLEFEWRRPFSVDMADLATQQDQGPNDENRITVSILMRVTAENGESFERALRTALAQTYKSVEVVILEDGSAKMGHRISPFIAAGFPIRYISVDKVGRAEACNLLFAAARGTHYVFLDDDDYLFLEHIETLVYDGLGVDKSYAAAWAAAIYADKTAGRIEDREYFLPSWYKEDFDSETMLNTNYFPIQSILFSSVDALAVGRVNVRLEYLEDWNFFGKLTSGRSGKVVKRVTSAFRLPRDRSISRQRGKQHLAFYDTAQDDIVRHIARETQESEPTQNTIRLLYHRIGNSDCDPFASYVSTERFESQLNVIINRIDKGAVARAGGEDGAPVRIEVHFDDAYLDIEPVARACAAHGLDVKVFATGYSFGNGRFLPGDEYLACLGHDFDATKAATRKKANGSTALLPTEERTPAEWYRFFCDLWKDSPESAEEILTSVREATPGRPDVSGLLMAPGDLEALSEDGCTIGAHGFVHTRLAGRDPGFADQDIDKIVSRVGQIDAAGARHFAFPYGSSSDIDNAAVNAAAAAGCDNLYSCLGHDVDIGGKSVLGRFQVGNLDSVNFAECLDRCLSAIMVDGNLESIRSDHFCHEVAHVLEDTGW